MRDTDVLIVGGGLSGTLLAMQLLRLPGARHIVVVEPRAELGRGEAYSATELGHTLNGNAARMSVEPDDADDLTRWLQAHIDGGGWPESGVQPVPVAELFPPRGLFGLYAQQRLAQALAVGERNGSSLTHVRDEVVDLQTLAHGVRVMLKHGEPLQAGGAVLATAHTTGNSRSARTPETCWALSARSSPSTPAVFWRPLWSSVRRHRARRRYRRATSAGYCQP